MQTDLYGLVGTVHVIVHGEYMKVYQGRGVWRTTKKFGRLAFIVFVHVSMLPLRVWS